MKNDNAVCAVVVTYNRKELLVECLDALANQTAPLKAIYIIDNFSNDGTAELLLEKKYINELPPKESDKPWEKDFLIKNCTDHENITVHFVRMYENTGGAGGFYEGVKRGYEKGYEKGYDWVWLMDDDVEPYHDSLDNLLSSTKELENIGFLSSVVRGIDRNTSLNVPNIDFRPSNNGYPSWDKYLDRGIVKLKVATFVSCFVPRSVIKNIGFPIKEMFIWGDDTEYTNRITDAGYNGYFVGRSKVLHKRHNQKSVSIASENEQNRINMYYFFYRNHCYMKTKNGFRSLMGYIRMNLFLIIKILISNDKNKYLKAKTIFTGLWDGIKFEKQIKL
jgi:GT2 family glycosyltransferase